MEKAVEYMCIIKTKRTNYRKIEAEIRKLHRYEVPEILALPIVDGSRAYLKWLDSCTG